MVEMDKDKEDEAMAEAVATTGGAEVALMNRRRSVNKMMPMVVETPPLT